MILTNNPLEILTPEEDFDESPEYIDQGLKELLLDLTIQGRQLKPYEYSIASTLHPSQFIGNNFIAQIPSDLPLPSTTEQATQLAIRDRKVLSFVYRNVYNNEINTRRCQPLRTFIAQTTGNYILLTWDLVRNNYRAFIIPRIQNIRINERFLVDLNNLRDKIKLHFIEKEINKGFEKGASQTFEPGQKIEFRYYGGWRVGTIESFYHYTQLYKIHSDSGGYLSRGASDIREIKQNYFKSAWTVDDGELTDAKDIQVGDILLWCPDLEGEYQNKIKVTNIEIDQTNIINLELEVIERQNVSSGWEVGATIKSGFYPDDSVLVAEKQNYFKLSGKLFSKGDKVRWIGIGENWKKLERDKKEATVLEDLDELPSPYYCVEVQFDGEDKTCNISPIKLVKVEQNYFKQASVWYLNEKEVEVEKVLWSSLGIGDKIMWNLEDREDGSREIIRYAVVKEISLDEETVIFEVYDKVGKMLWENIQEGYDSERTCSKIIENNYFKTSNYKNVYALIHKGKEILLVKTDTGWALPGGEVNEGETSKQAIERELFEECNIVPDMLGEMKTGNKNGEPYVVFEGAVDQEATPGDDAQEATYFDQESLPDSFAYPEDLEIIKSFFAGDKEFVASFDNEKNNRDVKQTLKINTREEALENIKVGDFIRSVAWKMFYKVKKVSNDSVYVLTNNQESSVSYYWNNDIGFPIFKEIIEKEYFKLSDFKYFREVNLEQSDMWGRNHKARIFTMTNKDKSTFKARAVIFEGEPVETILESPETSDINHLDRWIEGGIVGLIQKPPRNWEVKSDTGSISDHNAGQGYFRQAVFLPNMIK